MSGSGKVKPSKQQRANATSSASQSTQANDEEVTATMLRDMLETFKAEICNTIDSSLKGLQADIAAVRSELCSTTGAIQQTITLHEERLAAVEDSATKTSDALTEIEVTVAALKDEVQSLQNKCEDLENRSRRNNLRLIGIPEGEEGKAPTAFISNFLKDLLDLDETPLIDRAHRLAQSKPKLGQPPRPFILRVHYFHVKEQILRLAREKGSLRYKKQAIHIFGDLTAGEARKRAAFNTVRKSLQNIDGARFGFRYPATFRITLPGKDEQRFTDPQKAMDYVKSTPMPAISEPESAGD